MPLKQRKPCCFLEDVVMRTYDFTPLFRSTVGFDRLFDMIESSVRPDWPPYNIEKTGENQYRISMAIAGFAQSDIDLVQQGNTLVITGQKKPEPQQQEICCTRGWRLGTSSRPSIWLIT